MTKQKGILILAFSLLCSASALAQGPQSQNRSHSCRRFVKNFYSWYLASASQVAQEKAGDVAIKRRSYVFSKPILQALREDKESQRKAGSDLVWTVTRSSVAMALAKVMSLEESQLRAVGVGQRYMPFGTGRRMQHLM
jgi:hypothetical protein